LETNETRQDYGLENTQSNDLENDYGLSALKEEAEPKVDTMYRNWMFTINNPEQTEAEIYTYLSNLDHVKYFIFAKEKESTEHYQGYIEFSQPVRFSRMQRDFSKPHILPGGHLERRKGKRSQARDYILKLGKYADKAHTRIGEIQEYGEYIEDGQRTDLEDLVHMVKENLSDYEIAEQMPNAFVRYGKLLIWFAALTLKKSLAKSHALTYK